jgi:hypothetical protein
LAPSARSPGGRPFSAKAALDGINLALDEYTPMPSMGIPIKVFSEDTKADVEVMITKLDSLKDARQGSPDHRPIPGP